MMRRRGFLGAVMAAMAAPAIVRSGSLMRINPAIIVPPWGEGIDIEDLVLNDLAGALSRDAIVQMLRDRSVVMAMGARMLFGLSADGLKMSRCCWPTSRHFEYGWRFGNKHETHIAAI